MTYAGRPVLIIRPNFDQLVANVMDDVTSDNQGSGVATPWQPTTAPRRHVTYPFLFFSKTELKAFRVFCSTVRGRLDGFWIPLFLTDYAITQNQAAGDTAIQIGAVGLSAKVSAGNQFAHLAIISAGKLECYGIRSVTGSGNVETVTLDRGLDTALIAQSTGCCGLMYGRFADDEIALNYTTDSIADASIQFVELPREAKTPNNGSGNLGSVVLGTTDVFLYSFTRGSTTWRYCNYGISLTIGGYLWTGADITHGAVETSIEFLAESLDLQIATDDPAHPLRYYVDRNATDLTTVAVYSSSVDGMTFDPATTLYSGRISGVSFDIAGKITPTVTSLFRMSEIQVPTKTYTRSCENTFCDTTCGLSVATYTTTGTVTAYGSNHIDAVEFGAKALAQSDPNWFALGKVVIGNEQRLCTGQSGNRLYLAAPFQLASIGASISAIAGCNKSVATCGTKFGNLRHTLQFPYIPNKNPQFEAITNPNQAGGKKG